MPKLTAEALLKKQKEIEEAKEKVSELKGTQKALLSRLKSEYGCDTLEKAKEKLTSLQQDIEEKKETLESKLEKLQEKLENYEDS